MSAMPRHSSLGRALKTVVCFRLNKITGKPFKIVEIETAARGLLGK